MLHANIRSLVNKTHLLELALENVGPQFLCLSETWTNHTNVEAVRVQGYEMVAQYSRSQSIHGGVAIMVESGIAGSCTPVKWVTEFSEELHFESTGMLYERAVCIVAIYRSSNSCEYDLFLPNLKI